LPLYEYKCVKCGHRFEKIESVNASETKKCPKCGARAPRMASAPAIQFKGSGWYVTDYAGKGSAAKPSEGSGEPAAKGSEKSSDKSADSKSESKTESKSDSKSDSKSESKSESKPAASDNSNKGAANRKKK
jgi:putative FmdB family regulatory protein